MIQSVIRGHDNTLLLLNSQLKGDDSWMSRTQEGKLHYEESQS